MRAESLGENLVKIAAWGAIPFDHYVLEHWSFELPPADDGAQWCRLVKEYLRSSETDRQPYKEKAMRVRQNGSDDKSQVLLTASNIERVLKPFQSIRERNLSQLGSPGDPIWITACYQQSLQKKYCELERQSEVGGDGVDVEMVLSDADIYNVNGDIEALRKRITERLPGLFDHDSAPAAGPRSGSEDLAALSDRMATLVYVADDESVSQNLVKVLWFDRSGQLLLVNKLEPQELEGMTAMFSDGYSMAEAVDEKCLHVSETSCSGAKVKSQSKKAPKKSTKSTKSVAKDGSDAEWETESEYGSN